jgi:hypothetical protein
LRANGVRAVTSQRRAFGKHFSATGLSSILCFRSRSCLLRGRFLYRRPTAVDMPFRGSIDSLRERAG